MKINLKLIILWITSLAIFVGVGIVALVAPDLLSGVYGLVIRFFLGYCGIIVVAQTFAFMEIIRRQQEDPSEKNRRYHTGVESA